MHCCRVNEFNSNEIPRMVEPAKPGNANTNTDREETMSIIAF